MRYRNNNLSRSKYGGSRFRGSRPNRTQDRRKTNIIDERMFVNKARPVEDHAVYEHSFRYIDLNIHPVLKANITSKGYDKPTPIQDQTIPHILKGKDVLGIANTGTGKTAAFLIPLVQKVTVNAFSQTLIIAPTRELAEQIDDELYSLTRGIKVTSARCIGGASISNQVARLRRNPHFIVGTPGRLKDLIHRRALNLSMFNSIVLDEVDRMLDMGFINDIRELIGYLPKERQSLFFSATVDQKIEQIINLILKKDHVKISVKVSETPEQVEQDIIRFRSSEEKSAKLEELLHNNSFEKVLVFVNMKWHVDKLERFLRTKGIRAESIHGNKSQGQRSRAIENFKANRSKVLLATDIAARGLDISNITHVINYDIPNTYDDYVHRIGRTGRAEKFGMALTFVPNVNSRY